MPLGRFRSKTTTVQVPTPINRTIVRDALGNESISYNTPDGTSISEVRTTPEQQALLRLSQAQLTRLARELARGGTRLEARQARQLGQRTYEGLAATINGESSQQRDVVRSELARRFGGSLSSTFGNELLARLEGRRLSALGQARQEADTAGEQFLSDRQQARLARFQAFQQVLGNQGGLSLLNNSAAGQQRSLGQSLAIAQLQRQYEQDRQELSRARYNAFTQTLGAVASSASGGYGFGGGGFGF